MTDFLFGIFPPNSYTMDFFGSHTRITLHDSKYHLSESIKIPSNTIIEGNGAEIMFEKMEGITPIIIHSKNAISLRAFSISCKDSIHHVSLPAIDIKKSSSITLSEVRLFDMSRTAIKISDSDSISVNSCQIEDIKPPMMKGESLNSVDGIFIGGYSVARNISISHSSFSRIGNSKISSEGFPDDGDGIQILGSPENQNIDFIKIKNCTFVKCTARAIKVQSGENIDISGNDIDSCWIGASLALSRPVSKITIADNDIKNCMNALSTYAKSGRSSASDLDIINNQVNDCQYFLRNGINIYDFRIIGNTCKNLGKCFISGTFYRGAIENNVVSEFGTANEPSFDMAIHLTRSSSGILIKNNTFRASKLSKRTVILENKTKDVSIIENTFYQDHGRVIIQRSGQRNQTSRNNFKRLDQVKK